MTAAPGRALAHPARPGTAFRPRLPGLLRLRSSIFGKVLGALVVVLVVSTAVSSLVDARLTSSAVVRQTEQVVGSNLRVVQEAFGVRQRNLAVNLRALGDRLVADGLLAPDRRTDLIARLGSEATNLQLDQLDVVDHAGRPLDPPVSVGRLTPELPSAESGGRRFTPEPTSRLVPTREGPFVQTVPIALGTSPDPPVLLGGLEFGDELAFQLRRQLGGLSSVILVAGGGVVGSTLTTRVRRPPAFDAGSDEPPPQPEVVRIGDVESVVAYAAVGRSAHDPVGGAVGIALPDPAAPLDRALASRRLAAATLLAVLAVALGWLLFRVLTQPLVTLAATAERIAGGDLDEPFLPHGSDEIAKLAGALEHMRTELRAKLDLVAHQAAELQESSQRIVAAQDEERRRLARDLHDGIQQQLVVLRLRLGLAGEGDRALLAELGAELDRTIEQLREVSHDLYPAILRDRGLTAAVRSYAGRLPLPSGLSLEPDPIPRLPPDVETAAYFLICEAVTNVLKHAGATEVALGLAVDDGHLTVRVGDDGCGFEAGTDPRHGGLLHMEDRVRSFGGELRIESAPGRGTVVVATFPRPVAAGATASTSSAAGGRTAPPPPGG